MWSNLFQRCIYIQLSPQRVTVRNPAGGHSVSEVPEVAIACPPSGKEHIVAVGAAARAAGSSANTRLVNPFAHPRSLVSDFTVAEQLLKAFVKRLDGQPVLQLRQHVVVHPLGEHDGGLTQVELRALHEMGRGACGGAGRVQVWQGPVLSDQQILSGEFPATGTLHA